MGSINFKRHHSFSTLLRIVIAGAAILSILAWKWDLIANIYFKNQLTDLGWIINGSIVVVFAMGLLHIISTLFSYSREEAALGRFIKNIDKRPETESLKGVGKNSMIATRYQTLLHLHEARTPINQGALAATLVASESTRNSLPKFINNILILMGVFGTIVSLSIALVGASDVLENSVDANGMGIVIHGMSTALSTTITAIVCYVYFGYFYLRITDAQTNLISGIEQVTTLHLMPKYQVQTDSVLYEFTGLIRSLQGLVVEMEQSHKAFHSTEERIADTLDHYKDKVDGLGDHMDTVTHYLRLGFRLRDDE